LRSSVTFITGSGFEENRPARASMEAVRAAKTGPDTSEKQAR
jgi:hypothetical protein